MMSFDIEMTLITEPALRTFTSKSTLTCITPHTCLNISWSLAIPLHGYYLLYYCSISFVIFALIDLGFEVEVGPKIHLLQLR